MSKLSATMVLAPPGPRTLAIAVNKWAKSISSSFMAEEGRDNGVQEQDWLSLCIEVIINNSPGTGTRLSNSSFSGENYEFATDRLSTDVQSN
jgi:hypothetical protein